jgi:hypothetical protein
MPEEWICGRSASPHVPVPEPSANRRQTPQSVVSPGVIQSWPLLMSAAFGGGGGARRHDHCRLPRRA